jgi:hypothetical protein
MTRTPGIILTTLAAVLIIGVAALLVGSRRQRADLSAERDRLIRAGADGPSMTVPAIPDDDLPPPVARYLRLALRGTRQIREVRISQSGTLRTSPTSDRWMPFSAEHLVVPGAVGFVWDALVNVAPLLHVRVRDSLIEGRGAGHVSLLSAFTVSAAADTPEMNSGSLHRFLAEAVWYPTALLPNGTLVWTPIDRARALATLTDHNVSVSLEFRFAASGEVTGIYTPARWGTFADGYRQVPWEGHFRDYREHNGMLLPTDGEVGWYVDGAWRAVWRGTMTDFRFRLE